VRVPRGELLNGDEFFDRWGADRAHAFEILLERFDAPPSFDVFEYGLESERERTRLPLSVQQYARRIVDRQPRREP